MTRTTTEKVAMRAVQHALRGVALSAQKLKLEFERHGTGPLSLDVAMKEVLDDLDALNIAQRAYNLAIAPEVKGEVVT